MRILKIAGESERFDDEAEPLPEKDWLDEVFRSVGVRMLDQAGKIQGHCIIFTYPGCSLLMTPDHQAA
jgi:hypothetical protein